MSTQGWVHFLFILIHTYVNAGNNWTKAEYISFSGGRYLHFYMHN